MRKHAALNDIFKAKDNPRSPFNEIIQWSRFSFDTDPIALRSIIPEKQEKKNPTVF